MTFRRVKGVLPGWKNALLAIAAAILLILAFPDFEYWFTAWFAFVPLIWAIEREKESTAKSFALGWIFGIIFFFGTCWWLTYAPITYASFPPILAYFLLFCVTVVAGLFPATFAGLLGCFLRRFGPIGLLITPFIWVFSEFLRYWLSGNNWNAIAYSQAFDGFGTGFAEYGGVYLAAGAMLLPQTLASLVIFRIRQLKLQQESVYRLFRAAPLPVVLYLFFGSAIVFSGLAISLASESENKSDSGRTTDPKTALYISLLFWFWPLAFVILLPVFYIVQPSGKIIARPVLELARVVAVQPNVPMDGLTYPQWIQLRQKHVALAESALQKLPADDRRQTTVIFPESPMNFMYEEDPEFQQFVSAFADKHNVNVLFNSAEPDPENKKYFNSAVLVNTQGKEIAQYDKIYLVPFGESVPAPLQSIVPAFVGSFSYGKKYELLPIGDANAGVMICFESHFGQLSREFVRRGADVLVEMTNDGYLGPTPVLRQHLANAVFRAVETNRPVLRVTNVGITAYINKRGEVLDATEPYTEATRVWSVSKSDGSQTFYVKYGDWFAWLCTIVTLGLLTFGLMRKRPFGQTEN